MFFYTEDGGIMFLRKLASINIAGLHHIPEDLKFTIVRPSDIK
jgi:hypothetical protein